MPQRNNEKPTTYFVQDRQSKNELFRLAIQDQMITQKMGGIFPEQEQPESIQHVLDIGCGTGNWIIEAAQTYPTMSLVGIDISPRMIEYAQKIASTQSISSRVKFQVMDALNALEFPAETFDLVNIRLGSSFMRTWDWPRLITEMLRVTRPGGTIRIMESGVISDNRRGEHIHLHKMFIHSLFQAGHLFEDESTGLIQRLPELLKQNGGQNVQTKDYELVYQAGTEAGEIYYENFMHLFHMLRPFLEKWGSAPEEYDALYREALSEIRHPKFCAQWHFLCTWGTKRAPNPSMDA